MPLQFVQGDDDARGEGNLSHECAGPSEFLRDFPVDGRGRAGRGGVVPVAHCQGHMAWIPNVRDVSADRGVALRLHSTIRGLTEAQIQCNFCCWGEGLAYRH